VQQKQRRIVKLLSLQERRLLAETANCANVERRLDDISGQIRDLQSMLERNDPVAISFSGLVLDRLKLASLRRQETLEELNARRAALLELKQQIKRIDKVSEKLDAKIRQQEIEQEKRAILERFSQSFDVSAE
jgi:hypothetical protein